MVDVDPQLEQQLLNEQSRIAKIINEIAKKEAYLNNQELRVRQNLVEANTPERLEANLKAALPGFLVPGNAGDINRIIWPFIFSTQMIEIAPGESIKSSFTVTQEASFIMMNFLRTTYLKKLAPLRYEYIDPQVDWLNEEGLKFTISDPQSGRIFFSSPTDVRNIGDPQFPTVLPSPQMVLPNSNIDVTFINENATNTFLAQMVFGGYRLRIDGGADLLSTTYG